LGAAPVAAAPVVPSHVGAAPIVAAPVAATPAPAPGAPAAPAVARVDNAAPAPADEVLEDPGLVAPPPVVASNGGEFEDDLQQDKSELFEMDHSAAVFAGYAQAGSDQGLTGGSGIYTKPNFAVLYLAIVAIAAILMGKKKRQAR
jgi:hypothetical protein